MITEYIRYTLTQHSREELLAAYRAAAEHLRAAPECMGFDLACCEEAANSFILRIRWTSIDDHVQNFRRGPHFPPFLAAIKGFIEEITEMRHYVDTGIAWQR